MTRVPAAGLAERARGLAARGRAVIGVAGAPGAGKSTISALIAAAVPGTVVVPMDGFHLPTAALVPRGWVTERGTPRTFDAAGYVELLTRLRGGEDVSAPAFDRSIEEPVADAIAVPSDTALVVTEGNYLLLEDDPWSAIPGLLDEIWFLDVPEDLRLQRLVARHMAFGRTSQDAWWRATHGSDAANASRVLASRHRADVIVTMP